MFVAREQREMSTSVPCFAEPFQFSLQFLLFHTFSLACFPPIHSIHADVLHVDLSPEVAVCSRLLLHRACGRRAGRQRVQLFSGESGVHSRLCESVGVKRVTGGGKQPLPQLTVADEPLYSFCKPQTSRSLLFSQGIPESQLSLLPQLLPNTELLQSEGVLDRLKSPGEDCEAHADALLDVRLIGEDSAQILLVCLIASQKQWVLLLACVVCCVITLSLLTVGTLCLQSFGHQFPYKEVLGILLGYLGIMHIATYVGLHLASRKEQR